MRAHLDAHLEHEQGGWGYTFGMCNVVTAPKPGFSDEESEFEEESSHYDTAEEGEMSKFSHDEEEDAVEKEILIIQTPCQM